MALELQQMNPGLKSVTYGAPVVSVASGGERYRNLGGPVTVFDLGAKTTLPGGVIPHSDEMLAGRHHEFAKGTEMDGYYGCDKSLSLYQ